MSVVSVMMVRREAGEELKRRVIQVWVCMLGSRLLATGCQTGSGEL